MKALLLLGLLALANCSRISHKRSVGHYDNGWAGANNLAPHVISSYTTVRELPAYYVNEGSYNEPSYGAPVNSYGAPGHSYEGPINSYTAPVQSYQSYGAPINSYEAPVQSYVPPVKSHLPPIGSYSLPSESYGSPQMSSYDYAPSYAPNWGSRGSVDPWC